MREYWLKHEMLFFKYDVPQHRKDKNPSRKCTKSNFPSKKLYPEQMFVSLRTKRMQLRNHADTQ